MNADNTIILVPARMASTRLPGKPLADIAGLPMIVQVVRRAEEAECGRVVVATDSPEIMDCMKGYGKECVMTAESHQSGSDRIYEALEGIDPERKIRTIINVQGDLPTIEPRAIQASLKPLADASVDFATLATEISEEEERTNPNVVKLIGTETAPEIFRALYFSRATAPWGDGPLYHHIGLYAWRREALERFVSLPQSTLEKREKLEQLRGLENGMVCAAALVDTVPLGVDTAADLEKARRMLAAS